MSPPSLDLEVELLHWPAEADRRFTLAAAGVPRLMMLEPGTAPPRSWADDEDWVRLPASPEDLAARARGLQAVASPDRSAPPVVLDADGVVVGVDATVQLTGAGAELLVVLLDRWARPVERLELEAVLLAGPLGTGDLGDELRLLSDALAAVGLDLVDLDERTLLLTER